MQLSGAQSRVEEGGVNLDGDAEKVFAYSLSVSPSLKCNLR